MVCKMLGQSEKTETVKWIIIYGSGVYLGFYEVACPSCSKKVRFVRMKPPNRMPCLGCQRCIYVDGEYVKVAAKGNSAEASEK